MPGQRGICTASFKPADVGRNVDDGASQLPVIVPYVAQFDDINGGSNLCL